MQKNKLLKYVNRGLIVCGVFLILLLTRYNAISWNDASRFATIEKIVTEHTFSIDNSIFDTGDKIQVDGFFYSDKPPIFALFAAIPSTILYQLFDIGMVDHPREIVYITNVFSLLLPFLLYFYLLYYTAKKYVSKKIDTEKILLIVILLAGGTVLLSYTGQLNNHLPAAMLVGVASLLLYYKHTYSLRNIFWIGFLLSLATTFDLGVGFIVFFSAIIVGWNILKKTPATRKKIQKIILYFLGASIPALIHVIVNVGITGDIFPGSMHPEFFNWDGSYFNPDNLTSATLAVGSFKEWIIYIWYMLGFGYKGMLLHSPIIGLGIGLIIYRLFTTKNIQQKIYALFSIVSIFIIIVYYSLYGKGGAGTAYTIRWFLIFFPLVFPVLIEWALKSRRHVIYFVLCTSIPMIWHISAIGNVMGSTYNVHYYSFANAMQAFPAYFLLHMHSILELF